MGSENFKTFLFLQIATKCLHTNALGIFEILTSYLVFKVVWGLFSALLKTPRKFKTHGCRAKQIKDWTMAVGYL